MKSIKYFVHVAEVGNISVAAKQLHLAQPALSRHIKKVEEQAGTALFYRLPRGVQLTPAGQIFLRHCRSILNQLALAHREVTLSESEASGPVVIGIPGSLTETVIPGILETARERLPRVKLKIMKGRTPELLEGLLRGEFQAALLHNPTTRSRNLVLTPLAAESLVVYTPALEPSTRMHFTLDEIEKIPVIIPPGFREIVDQQIGSRGKRLNVEHETDSLEAIRRMLLRGTATTILPVSTFSDDVKAGAVSAVPIKDVTIHLMLVLAHQNTELPAAVRAVVSLMHAEVARLAQENTLE